MTDQEWERQYSARLTTRLEETGHPGFSHSGSISDGSMVTCHGCGVMVDCYSPAEELPHLEVCPWMSSAERAGPAAMAALVSRMQSPMSALPGGVEESPTPATEATEQR